MFSYRNIELFIVFYSQTLGLLAIAANLFVIYVIVKKKALHTTTYFYLANQALSDAIYGLCQPLVVVTCAEHLVESNKFFLYSCQLSSCIFLSSILMSSYFIMLVAIDRYQKLYHPTSSNWMNAKHYAIGTWSFVFLVTYLSMTYVDLTTYFSKDSFFGCVSAKIFRDDLNLDFVFNNQKFFLWMPAIVCLVPVVITALLYNQVVIKLNSRKLFRNQSQHGQDFAEKRSFRTVKMLMVMMMLYYSIMSPFLLIHIQRIMYPDKITCAGDLIQAPGVRIALATTLLSALANPVVLFCYNKHFSDEALLLIDNRFIGFRINLRRKKSKNIQMTETSTTARALFETPV